MKFTVKEVNGRWCITVGSLLTYDYLDIKMVDQVVLELKIIGYTQIT